MNSAQENNPWQRSGREELRVLAERIAGEAGMSALKHRRAGVTLLGSKSSAEDIAQKQTAKQKALDAGCWPTPARTMRFLGKKEAPLPEPAA